VFVNGQPLASGAFNSDVSEGEWRVVFASGAIVQLGLGKDASELVHAHRMLGNGEESSSEQVIRNVMGLPTQGQDEESDWTQ